MTVMRAVEGLCKTEPSPGFHDVGAAKCPSGKGTWTVRISREAAEVVCDQGPVGKFHDLFLVPDLLDDPHFICEGLRRKGAEKHLCYVGRPQFRKREDGQSQEAPMNRVFLVFVSSKGTLLKWRWDEMGKTSSLREFCEGRFERIRWARP